MHATLWSDYLCPWCYLGRDRTRLLEELGVGVTHLPFELHPDLPMEGRRVRRGGRLHAVLEHIAAECASVGLPFTIPERLPNTRRALESAEVVRRLWPDAFTRFDGALFDAVFVDGLDLADPSVIATLAEDATVPVDQLQATVAAGTGSAHLAESMARARDAGVAATPAWAFDTGLLVPGVQPREVLERWVERMRRRAAPGT